MVYLSITYLERVITLYDYTSVPNFVIKEASSGPAKIVDELDRFVLYVNGEQWMSYHNNEYVIKELYSSYDLAYGDVIISGLGFGILALWLCSKPSVTSVTVIELSEDVIKLFKTSNFIPDKLNIINKDVTNYKTDKEYDVVLLDHYEKQDFNWRLKDIEKISNNIKHKIIWAWSLEQVYLFKMYSGGSHQSLDNLFLEPNKDFSALWTDFIDEFLPKEKIIRGITKDKLNNYIYTYFNREQE